MPRINPGPPCIVCGKPSAARELCDMHYHRWIKHGHTEQTRPATWGQREKHPLYSAWTGTRRRRGGRVPEWDDFWQFVSDVGGGKPHEAAVLKSSSDVLPIGPTTAYWSDPLSSLGVADRAAKAEYQRKWRVANPLKAKQNHLRKNFGIGVAEYEEMLAKQGGGCAICGQRDKWFRLAVDHCHGTKRIRGLLCAGCNRGIGIFKDSPDLLRKAVEYLER